MERLSPRDLVNLRVEDRGLPMHVAALIIFDGAVGAGLADSGRAGLAGPSHSAPRTANADAPQRPEPGVPGFLGFL